MSGKSIQIGVLALQGAFREHRCKLEELGATVKEVRKKEDLKGLSGLIIPGGESTAMSLLGRGVFFAELKRLIKRGLPVYGTCAGAILLAQGVSGGLEVMDMEVERNAYGSQLDSFIEEVAVPSLGLRNFPAVFIRAPVIKKVGPEVSVLAKRKNGEIIMARQGNVLVSTFHPELTSDLSVHRYFVKIAQSSKFRTQNYN